MTPLHVTEPEEPNDKIQKCREALALHPEGHPDRLLYLLFLAIALQEPFDQEGRIEDLTEIVNLDREALELCPDGHPLRSAPLNNLANALRTRFQRTGQQEDLDEAIGYNRETLSLHPKGDPLRSRSLNNLANALHTRFHQTGQQGDLDESITHHFDALSLRPKGHPDRSSSLNNLAEALRTRFERTGQQEDLDETITHTREALSLRLEGHPLRSLSLSNLAIVLQIRFEQRGQQEDLDEAIVYHRDALSLHPENHPDRSPSLSSLASALHKRFEQRGEQEDLDEAIKYIREALSLCPKGHSERPASLDIMAENLQTRFKETGQQDDLDEAIGHLRESLSLRLNGHPDRASSLNNLANSLRARFEQTGQQEDLDEAIGHHRDALSLPGRPKGLPNRSLSLNNLAETLRTRFWHSGQQEDLDEAIMHHREALALLPTDHPLRSMSLNNLAEVLRTRFQWGGKQEDLDDAIAHNREALSLYLTGHPFRSGSLNNLANTLQARFEQMGKQEDLAEAIKHHREALSLRPEGHPLRSASLNNLVIALIKMHEYISQANGPAKSDSSIPHGAETITSAAEADYLISLLESAAQHETSSLKDRLKASFNWASIARQLRHESITRAYSAAFALLARISMQRSTLESQHESFSSTFYDIPKSFISDAASSAIEAGMIDTAVEFLEQGRGLLWSRMKGYRHPLLQLHETNPELAKRYETLGARLERHATASATDSIPSGSSMRLEAQWQEYRKLSEKWNEVVEEIRNVDGFHEFLKPPHFSDLRKVAESGPVVLINVSKYRSDAIILFDDIAPVLVPLPYFTPQDLGNLFSQFLGARSSHSDQKLVGVLRDLWKMVVGPVVDYLKSHGVPIKSRIWWCPTSQLCALPLHAAGPYKPKSQNLPDIYISSYTPTLSALISAREGLNIESVPVVPQLLVVGEPDGGSIPAVEEEVRRIQHLGPFVEVLSGETVSCKNVVQALGTHSWSHFACHGILDPIPFHSSFKLHNGEHLELIELIKARLPEAELAFLSACHAAAVHLEGAPDEVIHLSAAMQFCGFRSVVGTLWAMADEDGPDVAEDFYRYMLRDLESGRVDFRDAAAALNLATKEMRRRRIPLSRWVNFVHIGA